MARIRKAFWLGRHVVVTGGSSGIGLEITRQLLKSGARVTVLALDDRNARRLRLRGQPHLVVAAADLTDPEQVASAVQAGRAAHGGVQSLITCAGIVTPGYFHLLKDSDLRRQMEVNYFGTVHAVRHVLPDLLTHCGGSITCISSAAGLLGAFGYGAYSPSKFAVRGLCEVLRQEYKPHGITVTGVYPPDVDTPMLAAEQVCKPPELLALSSGKHPLSAQEVAQAVLVGTRAGRAEVLPGVSTKAIRFAAGVFPGVVQRYLDFKITRARRALPLAT